MTSGIIWLATLVLVIGYLIYRTDKRLKQKYQDKFSPHEWDLPVSSAMPLAVPLAPVMQAACPSPPSYHRQPHWFSADQIHMYRLLQQALAGEYALLAKIHLGDLATAPPILETRLQRRVDFVVCSLKELAPLCVIELEDPQTEASDARQLEEICRSIQLPLAKLAASSPPGIASLRQQLLGAMGVVDVAPADEHKNCPLCSAPMQQRQISKGAQAGQRVWVCSTYPTCKGWVAIS